MKEMNFLKAFGEIDEKYILEAENYVPKKHSFLRYAASFAAILFISTAAIPFIIGGAGMGDDSADRQDISSEFNSGARGTNYVSAYDAGDLADNNPWSHDSGITTLPVYKNSAYVNKAGVTAYHTEEYMLKTAQDTAEALGETIEDYSFFRESDRGFLDANEEGIFEDDKTYDLNAYTSNYSISVYGNGNVDIRFPYAPTEAADTDDVKDSVSNGAEEAVKDKNMTEEDVTMYAEEYSSITGIENAVVSVTKDYGYGSDIYYYCTAYEEGENTLESVLNYNFSSVRFYTGDSGELAQISKDDILSSAEELGEYPIISQSEAEQLLIDGAEGVIYPEYMNGDEKIGEKDIVYSTLVYNNSPIDEYFLPYYVFYVDNVPENFRDHYADKDLKHYSVYYVMAIKEDSLSQE